MSQMAKIYVQGRVQGVGYRYATQQTAQNLGLSGWTRNLPDGRVEIQAYGPPGKIDALLVWCETGPRLAAVQDVEVVSREEAQGEIPEEFEIRR